MKRCWLLAIGAALLLSGCGGCQHNESGAPGANAGGAAAAPTAGRIQVAPLQPTIVGGAPAAPQHAPAAIAATPITPPAGAPAAGEPTEAGNEEGDCIVVADANPDYGPPPLSVTFSAEAECSGGQPTYKWDFGDNTPPSTETAPSHTYGKPGDYVASVTITAPDGATSSDEVDITVEEGEAEPPSEQ